MEDENWTKTQLIGELAHLRERVAALEAAAVGQERAGESLCAHMATETSHSAEQLVLVAGIQHTLAATLDQKAIWVSLIQSITQLFPDVAGIFISRYDEERRLIVAECGLQDTEWIDVAALPPLPLAEPGKGTQSYVIHTRQPLIISKGLRERLRKDTVVRIGSEQDTQSALYVPMLAQDSVIGIIQLQSYVPDRFQDADVKLLSLVANTAAVSVQNARLYALAHKEIAERRQVEQSLRESERRYRERGEMLTALYQAGQQLTQTLDTTTVFQRFYEWVVKLMPCNGLFIASFAPEDQLIRCVFAILEGTPLNPQDLPPIPLEPEGQGIQSMVIRTGKPLLLSDYQAHLRRVATSYQIDAQGAVHDRDEVPEDGQVTRSALLVPTILAGQVVGVIQVLSYQVAAFTPENLQLLESLSSQVVIAFNNACLYQQAQDEIAERRRVEAALRESENKFRSITENAADFIFIKDQARKYTFINPAMQALFGLPAEEILGKTPEELFGPEQGRVVSEVDDWAFAGETVSVTRELNIGGVQFFFDSVQTPLSIENGEVTSIMGIVRDVTEHKRMEEALRKSEAYLRGILANSPDVVYILDLSNGKTAFLNRETFCGYTRSELEQPGSILSAVHPDDLMAVKQNWQQITTRLTTAPVEYRLRGKNGNLEWIEQYMAVLARNPDGALKEVMVILRIVTERKKAESELAATQALLLSSIEQSPVPIVVATPDGTVTIFNQACGEILGITDEPETRAGINIFTMKRTWQDLDAEGNPIPPAEAPLALALQGKTTRGKVMRARRKDGTERWEIVDGVPIYDKHGILVAGMIIFPDITELKRAEEERARLTAQIRARAQELQQILATVPTGVLLMDAEWRVMQVNPVAEKALAVLAGVQVGDRLTRLGDRPLAELLAAPATPGMWHEIKAQQRTFEVIARPVESDAAPEHWVLVLNDVTREREIQAQLQQQERLAAVGQLAAGIAHDFNNIMASIVLYAQMTVRSPALTPRERERLEVIIQQSWHATRLIQQILDFSRRAILERRSLDLLPLLKEQVKLLKRTLPEHITMEVVSEPGEYIVHADPTRLQQMLTNLAVNARDAMPGGGVLRIGLARVTGEPGQASFLPEMALSQAQETEFAAWIRLTVTDTGAGIAPEALPHIFEPFFTTKEPGKGSGLGLPQVYGIVGQHGGHIDVTTQVGRGTTFTIYLPALEVCSPKSPAPSVSTPPQGSGETVLVVEDEAIVRTALIEILEMLGYRALPAANGREALALLATQGGQIALVLSDVVMPEMGGLALLRTLREQGWQKPVILLTGHPMNKELESLRGPGLAAWLLKPPDVDQLARAVAEALHPQSIFS